MFMSLSPWLHSITPPNLALLIRLLSLLCFSYLSSSIPPLFFSQAACTSWICLRDEEGGPSNLQRRLGSGSPPSRFIASVLPKSYFMVPSIRSLGSPQLPSPDAGLSPSLGTQTGHRERRHVTHITTARNNKHTYYLCPERGWGPTACAVPAHTAISLTVYIKCIQ